jgi:hypothetical protein
MDHTGSSPEPVILFWIKNAVYESRPLDFCPGYVTYAFYLGKSLFFYLPVTRVYDHTLFSASMFSLCPILTVLPFLTG